MNIIKLSNDSGLVYYGMGKDRAKFIYHLETFAALVEEAARADEREACAKVCEDIYNDPEENNGYDSYYTRPYLECADVIRARGTT